jgi:hypothetical protein
MAAALMLSGVSKSGSPAPRPITSLPCAFSSAAEVRDGDGGGGLRMLRSPLGEVLYVGKARLAAQGASPTTPTDGAIRQRIARMIAATAAMMFVTTETETEALLLEANLIKQLKPRFNVLLRDDKSFPLHPDRRRPPVSADCASIAG